MAVKKAVKPSAKAAVKKTVTKKKTARGDTYVCGVCGLAVVVDETCGCVDFVTLFAAKSR